MKIPAIKAKIGNWDYYITTLTFEQVSDVVSRIDDQLHQSESLKDLIQRSITNNYQRIKDYILNQPELFFNSLVLAVYDDYPSWQEVVMKFGEHEYFNMGFLDFSGGHKIFPVDGQHRVEGIKEALISNPELKNEKIGAIFIGHKNDYEGKKRTRRLFTTLNRYAKPVSPDDIIALDEDDVVAIITRNTLEEFSLFSARRVIYAKQKAIPTNNKDAITSIITLYQANIEIFKLFYKNTYGKIPSKGILDNFLKFRPNNEVITNYQNYVISYWNSFKEKLSFINQFIQTENNAAEPYRNSDGGNLIFRPIGFLPLIKASITIHLRTSSTFDEIFHRFNEVNFQLNSRPWQYVLWNPTERKMLMNNDTITYLLLIYMYGDNVLTPEELQKLKVGYSSKIAEENDYENVLNGIRD